LPEPLFPRAAAMPDAAPPQAGAQVAGSMEAFASLVRPPGSADAAAESAEPQAEVLR